MEDEILLRISYREMSLALVDGTGKFLLMIEEASSIIDIPEEKIFFLDIHSLLLSDRELAELNDMRVCVRSGKRKKSSSLLRIK